MLWADVKGGVIPKDPPAPTPVRHRVRDRRHSFSSSIAASTDRPWKVFATICVVPWEVCMVCTGDECFTSLGFKVAMGVDATRATDKVRGRGACNLGLPYLINFLRSVGTPRVKSLVTSRDLTAEVGAAVLPN